VTGPLEEGREGLRRIRQELLHPNPEALAACLPLLEDVFECVRQLQGEIPRDKLLGLLQELREVNALVRQAADFYLDCAGLLNAGKSAYGVPGALVNRSSGRVFAGSGRLFAEG
jgi:hypothetical protein